MAHKIQIKRGNKADLPTLDAGEFGLCQDTNELFIGNSGNQKIFPPTAPTISDIEGLQTALDGKVDNSQVLTNVPANAKFTDTVTTINGKTGVITKADITALGIPAQDTVYTHPATHSADMIVDGTTNKAYTAAEKNKLAGIEAGANKTTIANNLTETEPGKALDATQGKALAELASTVSADLESHKAETVTQTIHAPALKANLNLYVSPNGDDTTGDGSQAKPFRQITKAITVIPKNLNGYNAVINLAPGTYTGNLSIDGFFSGRSTSGAIQIVGGNSLAEAEDYIIDGWIESFNCSNSVLLKGITVTGFIVAYYSNALRCQYVISEEEVVYGIFAMGVNVHVLSCEISNKTTFALGIAGGILCAHGVSGSDNAVGYQAGSSPAGAGGIIIKTGSNSLTAQTLDSKYGGSQIW